MKNEEIGVLSFQNTINYGADLQIYSLCYILKKIGKNPIVINYKNQTIENSEFPKFRDNLTPKKLLKTFAFRILTRKKRRKFASFKNEYFSFSKEYTQKNFSDIENVFNKLIVGSDQVWNTNLTGSDLNYFFYNISEKIKKYAYAASFGVGDVKKLQLSPQISEALNAFTAISTREIDGEKIVGDISDQNAVTVLDPTFLLTQEEWRRFSSSSNIQKSKPYLLIYFIKNSKTMDLAKNYATENNLEIKYISMRPFAGVGIKTITDASPEDFISLIMGASAVIAGSYHGFILSLNLNIPVFVDFDHSSSNKNSRLESIIELFDLKNIGISNHQNLIFFNDYEQFNEKLTEFREKSFSFLKEI